MASSSRPSCFVTDNALMRPRRLRGRLLRFVSNRPLAITAGLLLAAPGALLLAQDYSWETGATDGLALVTLATGAAVAWSGLSGRRADWIEDGHATNGEPRHERRS